MPKSTAFLSATFLAFTLAMTAPAKARIYDEGKDVTTGSPFAVFLVSSAHLQALAQIAIAEDQALGIECVGDYEIRPTIVKILTPVDQPDEMLRPVAGRWIERFTASRCGEAKIYNAIFTADADGVDFTWGGPGTTALPLDLVRDLRPAIVPKANIPDCGERMLLDTAPREPDGYEKKMADGRYETWTVTGCGKNVDLVLLVRPNEDGTYRVGIEEQIAR